MKEYPVERLIRIAMALSTEKQIDPLLELILREAMDITNCDGGTIYILEHDVLYFNNMITLSKNIRLAADDGEELLPPVPLTRGHVCACSAMDHEKFNIPDIYRSDRFDFSGAQRYDAMNGYRTQSMLVIPMEDDKGNIIGVLQLINAMDGSGSVVPFDPDCESIISALTSLAAVSLNNNLLSKAVYDILHSFVAVMVDAIDARTPYNANHTKSMVRYAERFLDWLDERKSPLRLREEERDPFLMSVWLHDLGKLAVPRAIMDKPTRLGSKEKEILYRIEIAQLMEQLRALRRPDEAEDAGKKQTELAQAKELVVKANTAGFLQDGMLKAIEELGNARCLASDGREIPLLLPDELEALSVRKGTLTKGEREGIERHVVYTARFLSNMKFQGAYASVPAWAGAHHEFLDGSGYPAHIKADSLPVQVRLLTILDVYDALTAEDRPYKPPMPAEKAFSILESMRDEGKLDGEILALFRESGAWKKN